MVSAVYKSTCLKKIFFPSYIKRYVVYAYDTNKYRAIWAKLKNLAIKYNNPDIFFKVNPYRVLEYCYIKDNNGNKKHLGDAKHIFRTTALAKIFDEIAYEIFQGQQKLFFGEWRLIKDGLVIYFEQDGCQAEIQGTELLSVSQRLKIHIALLRYLRKGMKLKKAVNAAKRGGVNEARRPDNPATPLGIKSGQT